MSTRSTQSATSNQLEAAFAKTAQESASESVARTSPTSEYRGGYSSSPRDDSPEPTGPSLLLSDPSIPKSTYVSFSQPTTGPRHYTSNDTQTGQIDTASYGQSEKPSQPTGWLTEEQKKRYEATLRELGFSDPKRSYYDPTSALERQVNGTHYKNFAVQPIEFIHKNGIGFIEGNVIKYVCRYAAKDGIKDLEKAKHYIEMLIEMENAK